MTDGLRRIKAVFTQQVMILLGLALALLGFSYFTAQGKNRSLEVRTSEVLSQMEGAGKVEVAKRKARDCFRGKMEMARKSPAGQSLWRRGRMIRLCACSWSRRFALCWDFRFQR